MRTERYKTNINCDNCVAKVREYINNVYGVSNWEVDTTSKEKVLTVNGEDFKEDELKRAVQDAGFEIKGQAER